MEILEADWDPLPHERTFYRSQTTGDRGYLVRRAGKDTIRLDRPMQELLFRKTADWQADEYGSLFLESQVATIAFAADRALCACMGLHLESRKTWRDLSDAERIKFLDAGPKDTARPIRAELYRQIMQAMAPYTRQK